MARHLIKTILSLGALVAATGCATRPPCEEPLLSHPKPLASVPHVIHEEGALDLSVFDMTAEERKYFQDARTARIDAASHPDVPPGLDVRCIFVPLSCALWVAIYPVVLPVTMVATATGKRIKHSNSEPSLIPVRDSALIARAFDEAATGEALSGRVARRIGPAADGAPWLAVAMRDVKTQSHSRKRVSLSLRAEARSFSPQGEPIGSSEHVVTLPVRPIGSWTGDQPAIRRDIEQALDSLAASIASAYAPDRLETERRRSCRKPAPSAGHRQAA